MTDHVHEYILEQLVSKIADETKRESMATLLMKWRPEHGLPESVDETPKAAEFLMFCGELLEALEWLSKTTFQDHETIDEAINLNHVRQKIDARWARIVEFYDEGKKTRGGDPFGNFFRELLQADLELCGADIKRELTNHAEFEKISGSDAGNPTFTHLPSGKSHSWRSTLSSKVSRIRKELLQ